jgi:hypothetical protein
MQNRALDRGTPKDLPASNTRGPELDPPYITHRHKEMRSGQYAAPRQDDDTGRGNRCSDPRLLTKGPAVLTSTCVHAVSTVVNLLRSSGSSRGRSSATKRFQTALSSAGTFWLGVGRGIRKSSGIAARGVSRSQRLLEALPSSPKPPDQPGHCSAAAVCG